MKKRIYLWMAAALVLTGTITAVLPTQVKA